MAHELSEINGIVEMAFAIEDGLPWHGKGQGITNEERDDLSVWGKASRMTEFQYEAAPALYYDAERNEVESVPGRVVAYRSDTRKPIEIVSDTYKFVQPSEVLDFFDEVIKKMNYKMTSCGVLFGGRQFWAQAMSGREAKIGGVDTVLDSVLLHTGFKMATTGIDTITRVVCNNTARQAHRDAKNKVKQAHSTEWNPDEMKRQMGLLVEENRFEEWADIAENMSQVGMADNMAMDYFARVFDIYDSEEAEAPIQERMEIAAKSRIVTDCYSLWSGDGLGSCLKTADGTLWGAFNSVTEYVDHHRKTQTWDARFAASQIGQFAKYKERAWDEAVLMAA